MWHHPAELPPCWALQEAKELGQHRVQGREVGRQSPGQEEQERAEVLSRAACNQWGLEPLGAGAKGPEEALGGKRAFCVPGSCRPSLPQGNDHQGRNYGLQL